VLGAGNFGHSTAAGYWSENLRTYLLTYLLTYMAWVQPKHPAVKWLGASMVHGGIHAQILPKQNTRQRQNYQAITIKQ
jgi:hypothetical protein